MKKFLWDYSFDELFLAENGKEILEEINSEELFIIQELKKYYEKTAQACHEAIENIPNREFLQGFPNLMRSDMILQLCLIHSLGVLINPIELDQLINTLEKESINYFHEYRSFGKKYEFEQYSLFNQIALT